MFTAQSLVGVSAAAALVVWTGSCGAQTLPDDEDYHGDYIFGAPAEPSEAWIMTRGGKLYDNWIAAQGADEPEATHPAWPASNTEKTGATTHRCKSCHGWDYLGADGQYGSGSYQTGITGIMAAVGRDPAEIAPILRDETHGYTAEMLPDEQVAFLAAFVSRGTEDMNSVIDSETGVAKGDPDHGKEIFQTICASCHGYDGRALDWGEEGEPGFVGTEASENPWEVLHKIRNGHPGFEMVALRALGHEAALNVLAFSQTLPVE